MSKQGKNILFRLNAAMLQRLLVLFSMPLFATACSVPRQAQNASAPVDTTLQLVVSVPEPIDTMPEIKADSIIPVYECPVTVTPCYGVVATPIIQESIDVNFEIPEL